MQFYWKTPTSSSLHQYNLLHTFHRFTLAGLTPFKLGPIYALRSPNQKQNRRALRAIYKCWTCYQVSIHDHFASTFRFLRSQFCSKGKKKLEVIFLRWRRCRRESSHYFLKRLGDGMVQRIQSRWRTKSEHSKSYLNHFEYVYSVLCKVFCHEPHCCDLLC